VVPASRVYRDPLHLLAYGSDASFYRLLPKAVIKVHSEAEVVALLRLSQQHRVPVTFRAAGTSLSGQAITDSILIKVGALCVDTGSVEGLCVLTREVCWGTGKGGGNSTLKCAKGNSRVGLGAPMC
jgi:hypothetical protein